MSGTGSTVTCSGCLGGARSPAQPNEGAIGGAWRVAAGLGAIGVGMMAVARAGVAGAEWYGAAGALLVVIAVLCGFARLIGYESVPGEFLPDDTDP